MGFGCTGILSTEEKQWTDAAHVVPVHLAIQGNEAGNGVRILVGVTVVQAAAQLADVLHKNPSVPASILRQTLDKQLQSCLAVRSSGTVEHKHLIVCPADVDSK